MSATERFLKYGINGRKIWYIVVCPLYGRCPLFAKRGFIVYVIQCTIISTCTLGVGAFFPVVR